MNAQTFKARNDRMNMTLLLMHASTCPIEKMIYYWSFIVQMDALRQELGQ